MKDVFKHYEEMEKLISDLDYSNYKSAYEFALKISQFSWENALKVMINIIINNPIYFDERIRDSIYLHIDSEGNRSIYEYVKRCMTSNKNEDVAIYLSDMLDNLQLKYHQRRINLR